MFIQNPSLSELRCFVGVNCNGGEHTAVAVCQISTPAGRFEVSANLNNAPKPHLGGATKILLGFERVFSVGNLEVSVVVIDGNGQPVGKRRERQVALRLTLVGGSRTQRLRHDYSSMRGKSASSGETRIPVGVWPQVPAREGC